MKQAGTKLYEDISASQIAKLPEGYCSAKIPGWLNGALPIELGIEI